MTLRKMIDFSVSEIVIAAKYEADLVIVKVSSKNTAENRISLSEVVLTSISLSEVKNLT